MFFTAALTTLVVAATAVSGAAINVESNSTLVARDFAGDGTWYDITVGATACGQWYTNDAFVVAISFPLFNYPGAPSNPNNNALCGRLINLYGPHGSAQVQIRDKCQACAYNDIDMTPAVFRQVVGDQSIGRARITWNWA